MEEVADNGAENVVVHVDGVRPVALFDGGQQGLNGAGPSRAQGAEEEAVQVARRAPPLFCQVRVASSRADSCAVSRLAAAGKTWDSGGVEPIWQMKMQSRWSIQCDG